jgi:hypothetical protein
MNRVIQAVVITCLLSTIGCASAQPKQQTIAEVYLNEIHAEEAALTRMFYADDLDTARAARDLDTARAARDLDTARAAREMGGAHATK